MRLSKVSVRNFRSIARLENVRIQPVQALVGENNCGKSNLLRAIKCFLTPGAGGADAQDFRDPQQRILIECEFSDLVAHERQRLRPYLLGDRVILRKELWLSADERGRQQVKAEYHGYQAEPADVRYSVTKLEAAEGRVHWGRAAEAAGLAAESTGPDGKVTKASFARALEHYLSQNEVEYDRPTLGATQALGIPQNLLASLPQFFLLPAITDYSNEIDKRSSTTVFRQLMADLSERLLRTDPQFAEVERALERVKGLFNGDAAAGARLAALGTVESEIRDLARCLMPSVNAVSLSVEIDPPKDIFSKGIAIRVDDGVMTDVLDKGNGLQRTLIFALLQLLIRAGKARAPAGRSRPIFLAIEEPELYIHPHCQRLIFNVLRAFAGDGQEEPVSADQVLYTTHSPAFVDVADYHRICVLRKLDAATGTVAKQCPEGVLGDPDERKAFKILTSFGLRHNEVFFARDAVLVEGEEDAIAVIATARKLGRIRELPEEIGLSIVVGDGKGELAKFQKILNAFDLKYGVLLELDGKPEEDKQNAPILENLSGNRVSRLPKKLETLLGIGHFEDVRHAKRFFADPNNISAELEGVVAALLPV